VIIGLVSNVKDGVHKPITQRSTVLSLSVCLVVAHFLIALLHLSDTSVGLFLQAVKQSIFFNDAVLNIKVASLFILTLTKLAVFSD